MLYSANYRGFYSPDIHAIIPDDAVAISDDEYTELLAGQAAGKIITTDAGGLPYLADPPAPTPEQVQAAIVAAVQLHLDAFARSRGYDGILSACTYADSAVPRFSVEGSYCRTMRDATWAACYSILSDVKDGTRPIPSGYDEIEPELPALAWPDTDATSQPKTQ